MKLYGVTIEPSDWEDSSSESHLSGSERDYVHSRSELARTYRLSRGDQVGRADVIPVAGGEWVYLLGHGSRHRVKDLEVSRLRYTTDDEAFDAAIQAFAEHSRRRGKRSSASASLLRSVRDRLTRKTEHVN